MEAVGGSTVKPVNSAVPSTVTAIESLVTESLILPPSQTKLDETEKDRLLQELEPTVRAHVFSLTAKPLQLHSSLYRGNPSDLTELVPGDYLRSNL